MASSTTCRKIVQAASAEAEEGLFQSKREIHSAGLEKSKYNVLRCLHCGVGFKKLDRLTSHGKRCVKLTLSSEDAAGVFPEAIPTNEPANSIISMSFPKKINRTETESSQKGKKYTEDFANNRNQEFLRRKEKDEDKSGEKKVSKTGQSRKYLKALVIQRADVKDINTKKSVRKNQNRQCSSLSQSNFNKPKRAHALRAEVEARPFKCSECSYSARLRPTLQQHMRTHTGEKPFKCVLCPSTFRFLSGLAVHKRRHTGERRFKCDICNFAGTQWNTLGTHKKGHQVMKEFRCAFCPYWSSKSGRIGIHEKRWHDELSKVNEQDSIAGVEMLTGPTASTHNKKAAKTNTEILILGKRRRPNCKYEFVSSRSFDFKDFTLDLEYVQNNFKKCDAKLRVLPEVRISGLANLRS